MSAPQKIIVTEEDTSQDIHSKLYRAFRNGILREVQMIIGGKMITEFVKVEVEGKEFMVESGEQTGEGLKGRLCIPLAHDFEQVTREGLVLIENEDIINVNGGEVFLSMPRRGFDN